MTFDEYSAWAASVSSLRHRMPETSEDTRINVADPGKLLPLLPPEVVFVRFDHGVSGCESEAGELAEHLKHVRFHAKALDRKHCLKELGDLLWYVNESALGLGYTLEEVAQGNIEKLKARYPEGHFTVERSENRKVENE